MLENILEKDSDENMIKTFSCISDENDILQMYLKDIGRTRMMNHKEELRLAKTIAEGEKVDAEIAKKKIVKANLRLVISIAKHYTRNGILFMDLVQEGSLGLIKAAERFDYKKNFRFSTYATWWIRQTITRAIANYSKTIRIPVHMTDKIKHYKKELATLTFYLGREPNENELLKSLKITKKKLTSIKNAILYDTISLNSPVTDDLTIQDYIEDSFLVSPEEYVEEISMCEYVEELLKFLDERERNIIIRRFGINEEGCQTLEKVGKDLGFSKERIRQIQAESLKKLRQKGETEENKKQAYKL